MVESGWRRPGARSPWAGGRGASAVVPVLLLIAATAVAAAAEPPVPPAFSAGEVGSPPTGWRELRFDSVEHPTSYRVVTDGGERVLEAASHNGASLLYAAVDLDPARVERVAWRWKVERPTAGARLDRRRHDDAAARVYVAFLWDPGLAGPWQRLVGPWQRLAYRMATRKHRQPLPFAAICYVWADAEPPGTVLPNPSYERSVQVVLRGPSDPVGAWVAEERDARADFVAWFGFEPPPVSHLAVMTDSDDTGGAAVARYGDLRLLAGVLHERSAAR